jgi:regulator of sigma E protease
MDIFAILQWLIDLAVGTVLPFVVVLTVVVFVHEMGHFLVARWNGVRVEAFSVGFGKELLGYTDSKGTRWKLAPIPLGGYVRFLGDRNASSQADPEALEAMSPHEREGAFEDAALWRRALIVVAGPMANFIFAILVYTAIFMVTDDVRIQPVIGTVAEGSAAEAAGIQPGDHVLAIDGEPIETFRDMQSVTILADDTPLTFRIERYGSEIEIVATPRMTEATDRFGNSYRRAIVGISPDPNPENLDRVQLGLIGAFDKALERTWMIFTGTVNFIKELMLGKQDARDLRGPIGIAEITGQVATLGMLDLVFLVGFLSISIGMMNLLPVPMLDGGHLAFYAVEAVRGRAMSAKNQERAYKVGLTFVLLLMIFVTTNDIIRPYLS